MKKTLLFILLFILFIPTIYAEENKIIIHMFSIKNSTLSNEIIDEIKTYEGYGNRFELDILESCILNGNGLGKDIYTDNQVILDRLIKDYDDYMNQSNNSKQYPIFLIGKDVIFGPGDLTNILNKNIQSEEYNDDLFMCIKSNENKNCFGVKKKEYSKYIVLGIIIFIFLMTLVIIKFFK